MKSIISFHKYPTNKEIKYYRSIGFTHFTIPTAILPFKVSEKTVLTRKDARTQKLLRIAELLKSLGKELFVLDQWDKHLKRNNIKKKKSIEVFFY